MNRGRHPNIIYILSDDMGCGDLSRLNAGSKIRTPRLDRLAAGGCDQTICLADFMATCAQVVGRDLPDDAGEGSVSNLPAWLGEPMDQALGEATVHHSIDGSFSIRGGRWKLEMCPGSGGWSPPRPGPECEGLPPLQLYDLDADVGERRNVQAEHPDVVERLTSLLTRNVEQGRSTPGSPQPNTGDPWWTQLWWMQRPAGPNGSADTSGS